MFVIFMFIVLLEIFIIYKGVLFVLLIMVICDIFGVGIGCIIKSNIVNINVVVVERNDRFF